MRYFARHTLFGGSPCPDLARQGDVASREASERDGGQL
jgi:hypothetical protein